MANWIVKNIPNFFTLLNLSLGVLAINVVITSDPLASPTVHYYVLAAGFCDLLDGLLARKLKVQSEFGLQLDSLADLITFGVLPFFIYANYINLEAEGYLLLLVPICSAIRLAVFNIGDDQKTVFKGISTTAHGIFVATLPIIIFTGESWFSEILRANNLVILGIAIFFSWLMVSPLKMISLKFSNTSIQENWQKYLLIISSLVLAITLGYDASPYIILFYIILSVVGNFNSIRNKTEA
ncbi:CDP-alcohol phosphatidyltransferase family protein [Roseivirga sp.]|uniref:CDP-alcohol phosphatidyltransferase family protein n=1 Tax=Roseivirga sp. TaxID=1964215 RepID=UPI003B8E98BE